MTNNRKFVFISVLLFIFSNQSIFSQSTSYHARYSINERIFMSKQQIKTLDNGTLMVGKWGPTIDDSAEIMLIKFNEVGGVQWSKALPLSPRVENFTVNEMSDRSIALVTDLQFPGNVYRTELLLLKLTCQGDVMWSNRVFVNTTAEQGSLAMSLREGTNGDLILSSVSGLGQNISSTASVCRIDNNGQLVWSKTFRGPAPGTNISITYTGAAFYQNNKIFVFGFRNYYANAIDLNKQLFAMKLNYNTGAVEDQRSYNYTEFYTNGLLVSAYKIHFNAEQLADGTFALFGIFGHWSYTDFYLYKVIVNPDLSIKLTQLYNIPYYIGIKNSRISVFPNGETHIAAANYESETFYWYGTDNANNILRAKKIRYPNSVLYNVFGERAFQTGNNRSAYALSHINLSNSRYYIDQTQVENGDNNILPCLGAADTPFVKQLSHSFTTGTWSWVSITDNEISLAAYPLSTVNFNVTVNYLCTPDNASLPFKIDGQAAICDASNTYTYQVKASDPQYKPVQWNMDPAYYKSFQVVNDSTVTISFKNADNGPYAVKLFASGGSGCSSANDALEINVYPAPKLPSSLTVCTQNFVVHAGNWFKNYRWQDGSTDSVYTIRRPGTYTVELTTFCNERTTHTFNVYSDKAGIAPNSKLCKGDTAGLKAPANLINYSWSPDYYTDHISDNEVEVYPPKDTFYVLTSETTDGCKLKDTAYVTVKQKPVVSLGPDTVVCVQEDYLLQPDGIFAAYLWNTGAVSPSITVTDPNTYTLKVTNNDGCIASDTVNVTSKVCLREIRFPNAFTPNHDGRNDIFKPTIIGRLENFEMIIYNRWGQIVFRTTSPATGWNGSVNGLEQTTGTYIWLSRYKFFKQETKTARGTITVIK
jgi:gliding motility-associated-like protein